MKTRSEIIEHLLSLLPPEKKPIPQVYYIIGFLCALVVYSLAVFWSPAPTSDKAFTVVFLSAITVFIIWAFEKTKITKKRDEFLTANLLPTLFGQLLSEYTHTKQPPYSTTRSVIHATTILDYAVEKGIRNMLAHYKYGSIFVDEMIVANWGTDLLRYLDVTLTSVYQGKDTDQYIKHDMLLVSYPYPKLFSGTTVIRDKNSFFLTPAYLKSVRLESTQFHNRFEVFSDDQIEARFCLQADIMDQLTAYNNKNRGMVVVYSRGYVFLILPEYKNLFNVGFNESLQSAVARAYDTIVDSKNLLISIKAKLDIVDVVR